MRKFQKLLFSTALTLSLLPSLVEAQTADAISPSSLPGNISLGYVYNGATWDRLRGSTGGITINNFPAASALSDAFANPTTTQVGAFGSLWNGTTWDRAKNAADNADALAASAIGGIRGVSVPFLYNGATFDRQRSAADNADALAVGTLGDVRSVGLGFIYNGTTWDRVRSAVGTTGITAVSTEGTKTTYSASVDAVFAGANINDICALPGSATKTIRVVRVEFKAFATAAAVTIIKVSKRSAANTGTAGTAMTSVPHNSTNAAATALPLSWANSAAEVPGAAVGNVYDSSYLLGSAAIQAQPLDLSFGTSNDQSLVLNGVGQLLVVTAPNIATPAGSNFGCRFVWTEE